MTLPWTRPSSRRRREIIQGVGEAQQPLRAMRTKARDGFIKHCATLTAGSMNSYLAKDYENLADTLAAFVTLAAIQLGIRRLARA